MNIITLTFFFLCVNMFRKLLPILVIESFLTQKLVENIPTCLDQVKEKFFTTAVNPDSISYLMYQFLFHEIHLKKILPQSSMEVEYLPTNFLKNYNVYVSDDTLNLTFSITTNLVHRLCLKASNM